MDKTLKRVIIYKAIKIGVYERQPKTDEQYFRRKEKINQQYKEAENNYLLTADEKYLKEMKKINRRNDFNISRTEYEKCKQDIKMFREKYKNGEFGKDFWDYIDCVIKREIILDM